MTAPAAALITGPLLPAVILGCLVLAAILVLMAFLGGGQRESRRFKRRMTDLKSRHGIEVAATAAVPPEGRTAPRFPRFDRLVRHHLPRREALQKRLMSTGRRFSVTQYVMINFGVTLFSGFLPAGLLHVSPLVSLLIGCSCGLGLPHFIVSRMAVRRRNAFIALFPEAIDLIVRGLKSGLPVSESITTVGHELADPVGAEFRRIDQSLRLGQSFDEALGAAAERLDMPEFRFFVISLGVQRETGGNLAETLENLSEILRRRRQMRLKVKAMSSEAKASAMIIGALPFIMFGVLMVVDNNYVMKLFRDPRGVMLLTAGLVSMAIGIAVMAKMVKFEI